MSLIYHVDIGVQTDDDDPDVVYFLGGRHVYSQTTVLEEYPELTIAAFTTPPPIYVLPESDTETGDDNESKFNKQTNEQALGTKSALRDSEENHIKIATGTNSTPERSVTPVETKCSSTQLSAGDLLNLLLPDRKEREYVDASTSPIAIPKSPVKPSQPEEKRKSTFAEKTKSSLVKKPATPVPVAVEANKTNNSNTFIRGRVTPVTTNVKNKTPPIPNYRSNIASRCRTAVNTGQSQPQSQWKAPCNPQNANASKVGILRSKSMINPVLPKNQCGPNNKLANTGSNSRKPDNCPPPQVDSVGSLSYQTHSNSYFSLPDETSFRRRSHNIDEDGWETVKARSNRCKWSSSNSSLASSNANQSRNSLDKGSSSKLQSTPETIPQVTAKTPNKSDKNKNQSEANKVIGMKNNNCQQTKTSCNEKSGKENKKKEPPQPPKTQKDTYVIRLKEAADDETESSVDEDEITRKEADLDDAIREEELLEEELLQVEKDFERIEKINDVENESVIDVDNSASPGVPDVDDEFNTDKSHLYFVNINGLETTKKGVAPMKDPSVVPLFPDTRNSPAKEIDKGETLRRYEAKLAKAEHNRETLLHVKFNQFVELSEKFKALNETTKKLVSERDELIARSVNRRKQASEKRKLHLKKIQKKAHDEDSKAREIAFINLLEAQNKRHEYFQTAQEIEDRLQSRREERRLKLEARAQKITAVIQRQEAIKQDWQQKLEQIQDKRKRKEERIQREKEERVRERTEMAQEKARDREVRLSAMNAAKQAEKEELQKKIQQKQVDSARRHEENIEQIRQKAIELGSFRELDDSTTNSVRVCTLCKVMLQSEIHEMQHVRGRAHLDAVKKAEKLITSLPSNTSMPCSETVPNEGFGLKYIEDIQADKMDPSIVHSDKSRFKSVKKHVKKLFQKLVEAGKTFEKLEDDYRATGKQRGDPNVKSKIKKSILELDRLVGTFSNNKGTPNLATQMDRLMSEIRRAAIKNDYIQEVILSWNALNVALKVIQCQATDLPIRCKINACDMLHGFITTSLANGMYIVRGTGICTIMQICAERWNILIPDDNRWLISSSSGGAGALPTDPLIESLMRLLFKLLEYVANPFTGILSISTQLKTGELEDIKKRTHDIIGYLVTSGVIDRITVYCGGVRGPVDNCPAVAGLLQIFLDFLTLLVYILQLCWGEDARGCIIEKKEPDSTQLVAALESSELAGAVSMSYSLLIHQGAPSRSRPAESIDKPSRNRTPPPPGTATAEVIKSTLCLINAMARLDLLALQNVLSSETMSLQFRHIAGQLLWLIVPFRNEYGMKRLLTELIIAIGNFAVGNKSNQATIQSGQTPTVLQLLCDLPEEYFTQKQLQNNLFPTLLAVTNGCPENTEVLVQKKIDLQALENYMNSDAGKENVIMKRLNRMAVINNSISTPKTKPGKKKK